MWQGTVILLMVLLSAHAKRFSVSCKLFSPTRPSGPSWSSSRHVRLCVYMSPFHPILFYRCIKTRTLRIPPPAAPSPPLPLPFPGPLPVLHSGAPASFPLIHLVLAHCMHCFPFFPLLWPLHFAGLSIGLTYLGLEGLGFFWDCGGDSGCASVGSTSLLSLPGKVNIIQC